MKNLFVSGASGNLGETVVRYFSEMGWKILATYSSEKGTDFPNVSWIQWKTNDMLLTGQLSEKLEEFEPLSGWIHLIGGFYGGLGLDETTPQKMKQMINMNFESAYELTSVAFPFFQPEIHASVIFIGAEAALQPSPNYGAYGSSKAALSYYAKTLAGENQQKNISVNLISPSTIDTKPNRDSMPDSDFSRWIQPSEITEVMSFLLSEKGRKINGSIIRMNA